MPILKEDFVLNMARGLKAFLSLRVGFTREEVPDFETLEGKLEERTRKLDQAHRHLQRMRQQVAGKDNKLAALREQVTRTQEAARRSPDPPGRETPVFFVVGNGRSGTTWLQTVLNSHPEILCRGEGWFFNRNYRRDEYEHLPPRLPVGSLYNAIAESEYLSQWVRRSVWTAHEDPELHLDNLTHLAVNYFLTQKLAKAGKRIVGDKTASPGIEALEEIARIYPQAKVIQIVRDGRDVAVSVMHFLWSRASDQEIGIYDLEPEELRKRELYRQNPSAALAEGLFTQERLADLAKGWSNEVGEIVERGSAVLGDRYTEIRYENLLGQPEGEVGRLLGFLGADASEETVKKCVEATGFEQLSERKPGQEDSTSVRFRKGIAGDWRNVFTEEDKRIFKEQAGDLLVKLGYEKDHDW